MERKESKRELKGKLKEGCLSVCLCVFFVLFRKRREEAAKAREELKKTAAVEAPKVGIEEGAMLLLLECTLDDERPAPLEAVMGLTSALQVRYMRYNYAM